jgi:hypothetical protein
MPDVGRHGSQDPSLDAIRRADSFVDALADGGLVVPQDPADAELAALLGGWRDEMRWPPATGLIAEADAVAALNAGLAEKRRPGLDRGQRAAIQARSTQNRNRRGLSTIGAAAAAVLCIGGFGAVVAGAGPGDALYGVRNMLFGAPKQVRDDQVGLAAKTELNQVQNLIAQGDWEQAQDKLVAVSTQVATIDDQQQKQELLDQFNDLSAKVVERDPEATAPPGVVYTVPPSSAALVPAVEPTSTPGTPPVSTSTTPPTTESPTSETSSPSASVTSTAASTAPTTTPTSVVDSSATPTTTPAQQSQQTTTPTSAAPTTSADAPAPSTTAATPSAEQTTAAPVTTTADAPRAVGTTTAAPAPQTAVSETPPEPASGAPAPSAQTAPVQTPEPLPTAAVTTTPVLVPAG